MLSFILMNHICQHILMVEPAAFQFNSETATNNFYQNNKLKESRSQQLALIEFNDFVKKLINKRHEKKFLSEVKKWQGLNNLDLAIEVTRKKIQKFKSKSKSKLNIVAIDYGMKQNILNCLLELNINVIVVPANTTSDEILEYNPNGIFLSNGPGDPKATGKYAIQTIKDLIHQKIPIFGICLGHQLISLALGAKTKKMFQGHRGANHPVQNLENKKVEITSQNHGFVVTEKSIPKNVKITHKSLFDGSVEGIEHKNKKIFAVQYHPEASPGPHDSQYLFQKFKRMINSNA